MRKYRFSKLTMHISKESLKLYCLNLRDSIGTITPRVKTEISIREDPIDLKNIDPMVLKKRISNRDRIFIASYQSKPIAYLFATEADCWVNEIQDRLVINAGEIYLYDAYTDVAYRGKWIYPSLISNAAHYFKDQSYSNALIFTTASNKQSTKGIEGMGFYCYQTIHFCNLCGWMTWHYKKRSRNVKSRFSNEI